MKNTYKIARDINGNKICKISVPGARGFSIQTNGNLPFTHLLGIHSRTPDEVNLYIRDHGTKRQKELLGL